MVDLRDVESVAAKGMSVRAATALALVAELRAAREVVHLIRRMSLISGGDLDRALAAYDRLTEEPSQ